jgi:Na+-driven multidrug efflux pump
MAMSAMTAQNVGAAKWDRVTQIARVGVFYNVVLCGAIALAMELLDQELFALFVPAGSAALGIATHLNRVVTPSFVFFGVAVALFGVVRATGAVLAPLLILTVSLLVVRFPLAELFLDHYHVDAVWWSFPISSVLAALLSLLYYRYGDWRSAHMTVPDPAADSSSP